MESTAASNAQRQLVALSLRSIAMIDAGRTPHYHQTQCFPASHSESPSRWAGATELFEVQKIIQQVKGSSPYMPKVGIRSLAFDRIRNHYRQNVLRMQRALLKDTSDQGGGFFDDYPRFYETSIIGPRNRLNKRYRALIEPNGAILKGKSVLDIASHDGRWSFAAYKAGARSVLGIEARDHLVKNAEANMKAYGVPDGQVQFVVGDVFEKLDELEPGRFDTVFCLGFLYHTMHHMLLLNKIARLQPQYLVIDTCIDLDPDSIVVLTPERVAHESAGAVADEGDPEHILVGSPTRSALELMLRSAGYGSVSYFDWHNAGIRRWDDLVEYHKGLRISLVATRTSPRR